MIPLQRNSYPLQSSADTVMTRTLEGIIKFWNRSAEDLYGWRKEEALERVSHDLLKTHFPRPLDEIDSDSFQRVDGKESLFTQRETAVSS